MAQRNGAVLYYQRNGAVLYYLATEWQLPHHISPVFITAVTAVISIIADPLLPDEVMGLKHTNDRPPSTAEAAMRTVLLTAWSPRPELHGKSIVGALASGGLHFYVSKATVLDARRRNLYSSSGPYVLGTCCELQVVGRRAAERWRKRISKVGVFWFLFRNIHDIEEKDGASNFPSAANVISARNAATNGQQRTILSFNTLS